MVCGCQAILLNEDVMMTSRQRDDRVLMGLLSSCWGICMRSNESRSSLMTARVFCGRNSQRSIFAHVSCIDRGPTYRHLSATQLQGVRTLCYCFFVSSGTA